MIKASMKGLLKASNFGLMKTTNFSPAPVHLFLVAPLPGVCSLALAWPVSEVAMLAISR
jgi:hypothetical protein